MLGEGRGDGCVVGIVSADVVEASLAGIDHDDIAVEPVDLATNRLLGTLTEGKYERD